MEDKSFKENNGIDLTGVIGFEYDGEQLIFFDKNKGLHTIAPEKNDKERYLDITKNLFQSTSESRDKIVSKNIHTNKINSGQKKNKEVEVHNTESNNFEGSFCDYCDFRPKNRNKWTLEAHMVIHTGDKPFSCSVCEFSTASKHYLELHMRKHTGERPFRCHVCDLAFTRRDILRKHYVIHNNEKSFSCTECNFKCARKGGLYQHWSFHCKFEHFRCSECDFTCRKSVQLKNHLLIHPRIYSCSKCDYMGRCVEDLKEHSSIHNKVENKKNKQVLRSCEQCGKSYKSKRSLMDHIKFNRCKMGSYI